MIRIPRFVPSGKYPSDYGVEDYNTHVLSEFCAKCGYRRGTHARKGDKKCDGTYVPDGEGISLRLTNLFDLKKRKKIKKTNKWSITYKQIGVK